MYNFEFISKNN